MKLLRKVTACIATMMFLNYNYAQQSINLFKDQHLLSNLETPIVTFNKGSFPDSRRSEISIKVVRDFTRRFDQAENVLWLNTRDGVVVNFNEKGIKNKVVYTNGGYLLYRMRTYTEDRLPADVRAQVKSVYYDYAITLVNEITNTQQIGYIVHMQDKTSWKNVRIFEGEMEVVEDLKKPG